MPNGISPQAGVAFAHRRSPLKRVLAEQPVRLAVYRVLTIEKSTPTASYATYSCVSQATG